MKKIMPKLSAFLVVAMLVTSTAVSVSAKSSQDREYYKESISAGTWKSTVSYPKENDTCVYVKPSQCPNGVSVMQTWSTIGGTNYNKTQFGTVYLNNGSKYGIYNLIWESGGRMAYLRMTPNNGSGTMRGVWSPDSVHESGMIYV